MTTSNRFENAINKLYTAFHHNTLNPEDCKQCAVGNLLDHKDSWRHLTDIHGAVRLNYIGLIHQNLGRRFNGYSPIELLTIEAAFLKGCGYTGFNSNRLLRPAKIDSKAVLFNGLCEVVSILCKLEGIPNVMDCSSLFQFDTKTKDFQWID